MKTDRRLKGLALVWLMGALTLLGNSLQARTFYVNFEHVEGAPDNGLDTNDGLSTVTSWKHAPGDPNATGNPDAVVLQGGDRVIFKGGSVYKGYIEISWSGDPGNRLVFDGNSDGSWGEGRAIIDGEGEELGINARYRGFRSPSGESHILIDNFEIRNFRYYYHSVWGEGGYGIYIFGAGTDIEIANCYLHHLLKPPLAVLTGGRRGIGKPGTAVTAATFHDDVPGLEGYSGTPGQTAIYKICLGWTRSDYDTAWGYLGEVSSPNTLTVYKDIQMTQTGWNNDDPVGHDDGYFYWIFDMRQSVAHDVGPYGIVVQTHSGVSIHDNIVQHCRMGICVWTGEGIPVSNVRILRNDISEMSVGVQSSGRVGREVSDIVISGNTLHDFFPFTKNIWGWHNDGVYIWGDAAGPVGAYDVTIANNIFYGDMRPGATGLVYLQYGLSDIKVHGNVFAASSGTGYQVRLMTGPINNVGIYNNVFAKVPGDIRKSVSINGVTNATFRNNIEHLFESYSGSLLVSPGSEVGFLSDHNLVNNANAFSQDISFAGTIYSLEGWQAAGIYDQNSIIRQAPLFRNFPAFTAHTNADGTTERIFFQPNMNPKYPSDFEVGDHVEYEYDGVVRTVTAVSAFPSYIEVTPSLARASLSEEVVLNWKDRADFTYDVRLAEGSPAIDAGADLSAEIGSLTIDGVTRPQGAGWDIGAYEYVSADTTSPSDPKQGSLMDNSGRVPQDVVSADFNRDGLADLAIAFAFDDAVRWYYGRGDGTFSFQGKAEVGVHPGPLNDLPRALLAHDFDGDGFVDLAALCSGNPGPPQPTEPSLGILYGDPVGGFEPFRPVAMASDLAPAPGFSVALAAGTIDADDRLDLVVGHFDSNQVSVILHGGRRRWKTPFLIPVATAGEGPTAFSIADFDFDGATDLVVANRGDLQLWRGNGTGEFPWKATFADGADLTAVAAADFDEDGLWDLAALDGSGQSVDLYMGLHADGSTERVLALPLVDNASFPAGQGPADLVLYDANLDGRDDLALIYLVSGGGSLLLSQPRAVVPQEADAPLPLRFHHGFSTAQKPRSIIAADLNRDRMKDLAVIHEGDSSVGSNQDLVVELNALKPYQAERLIPQASSAPGRQLGAYLGRPRGLGWDPVRSALWTLDREERRLVRLSPESHVQFSVSLKTLSANPPVDPTDLAVDGDGYLWITDRLSASVFRFRPGMGTDSLKRIFSTTGVGLLRPSGIAVDHDGDRLLISDERRPVIMSFSLTGKLKNIYTITTGRPALDLAWDGAAEEPPAHGRLWAALGDLESEPPDLDSQPWPGQIVVLGLDDEQGEAAPAAQVTLGAVGDALSPTFLRSVAVDRMKWGERAGYRLGALTDSGTLMLAHVGIDEDAPSSPGSLGPGDPTIVASIEGIWELSLLRNVRSIARGSEGAVLLADGGPMATLVVVGPGDEVLQARMLNEPAPRPVRIEGLSAGPERIYVLDGLHEEIRAYETDGAFVGALGGEALEGRRPRGLHFEPATSHFFVGTAGRLIELDADGIWVRECRAPTTAAPGSISSGQRPGEVMLFSPSRNQFYYCDLGETASLRKTLVATQWLPSRFAPNAAALGTQANELVMAGSGEPTLLRLKLGLPPASAGNAWSLYR